MRLPRRWGARAEHQQTHPSLARRVRAIREAAAQRGLQLEGPQVSEIGGRHGVGPAVLAARHESTLRTGSVLCAAGSSGLPIDSIRRTCRSPSRGWARGATVPRGDRFSRV
jgi:hypothetical protein